MGTPLKLLQQQVFAELGGSICVSKLDHSIVNVELTQEQFDMAVALTMQWWTARKGYVVFRPVNVLCGVNDYQMKPDVSQVLDVIFEVPTDVAAFFSLGFFDLIPYGPQNIGSIGTGLTNYSGFAQLIQFNEMRKRVFSVTPEWWFEQQTGILHITNRQGALVNIMMVQAKLNQFDPATFNDKDTWIFNRYVTCKCKEITGRIRSKYDSLPAAGGTLTLDGKDLLVEAKEEMALLEKEIFASQGPDFVLTG